GRLERLTKQMGHLLGDGASIPFGSGLQFLVESIGKILDVQRRHRHPPLFLHFASRVIGRQACSQASTDRRSPVRNASKNRVPHAADNARRESLIDEDLVWPGGRDSEPFAACGSTSRCFPRDGATSQTSELVK